MKKQDRSPGRPGMYNPAAKLDSSQVKQRQRNDLFGQPSRFDRNEARRNAIKRRRKG